LKNGIDNLWQERSEGAFQSLCAAILGKPDVGMLVNRFQLLLLRFITQYASLPRRPARREREGKKSLVISIVTHYTTDKKHYLEIQDSSINIDRFEGR
jgi:hypothetical protein